MEWRKGVDKQRWIGTLIPQVSLVPHGPDGLPDVFGGDAFVGNVLSALVADDRRTIEKSCHRRGNEPGQLRVAVTVAQKVFAVVVPQGKKNIEPVLGPGAGNVQEPPFFLNLFRVARDEVRR